MPELSKLQRIRIATETTFGTDLSGTISAFKDLHAMMVNPAAISPSRLADEGVVQRRWQRRKSHEGPERPTLDLRCYLAPSATALNSGASPAGTPEDALGLFLYNMMGAFSADAGSTEDSGSSTTDLINVAVGDGSNWAIGGGIGCLVSGALEARPVAEIATDAITPLVSLSGAPTSGSAVYNAYNYYLSSDPDKSSQIIVESTDRDAIHWLLGMQGVPAFEINVNQLPIVSASMTGAAYTHDDDVGTPIGGSAISDGTLTDGDPIRFTGEVLLCTGTEGSYPWSRSIVNASVQITPQWTVEPLESPSGVEGVSRWIVSPGDPSVQATVMVEGYGTTYPSDRDARNNYSLLVQCGNAAAGAWQITLPAMQIDDVEPSDYGNLVGTQLTLSATDPYDIYSTSTDLAQSPIVVSRY